VPTSGSIGAFDFGCDTSFISPGKVDSYGDVTS
jgi:hypothetical protein